MVRLQALALIAAIGPVFAQREVLDTTSLIEEVHAKLVRSQAVAHHYAYRERSTPLHLNPFGRFGTSGAEVRRQRPARNRGFTEQQEISARERAKRRVDDVMAVFDFAVAGRETRDGVPSIVLSFTRKRNANPQTRQGRYASAFSGRAWVDEATREVTRIEASTVEDVGLAGFVGKVYRGTRVVVERKRIDGVIWLPTKVTLTGDARALFRKTTLEYVIEWSYVTSNAQLPTPKGS
jgi:hypothetical protein